MGCLHSLQKWVENNKLEHHCCMLKGHQPFLPECAEICLLVIKIVWAWERGMFRY